MKQSTFCIPILFFVLFVGGLGSVAAQNFDISSGGAPTIIGALGGSVSGSSSVLNNLSVTINFGEISPTNTSSIVKVIVPIGIRSDRAYQVTATVSGPINANLQALQSSDIGFGANNLRAMGSRSRVCTQSSHIFYSPFNNDPANGITLNGAGRATYPSTLNNVGTGTLIISGPRLSDTGSATRRVDNGYIFDAIFVITPQFYAAVSGSATLVFTITDGPNSPC